MARRISISRTYIYHGPITAKVWMYKDGRMYIEILRDDNTTYQIEIPQDSDKPINVKEYNT